MKVIYIVLAIAMIGVAGCRSAKEAGNPVEAPARQAPAIATGTAPAAMMPKAVLYKTNGDFNNNVSVNLDPSGQHIVSYPAPQDVGQFCTPVPVGDGWLLDRRGGVGANTAFLTYTYDEYSKLAMAPKPSELMSKIIPGAKVIETKVLPITVSEAMQDHAALKKYAE